MSEAPPSGYYFAFEDVDEPPEGLCWFIKVYENPATGRRWASRRAITREAARNWRYSPFRGGRRS